MDFWHKIQDNIDKGISKSAELLSKAKEKAIDLSEKGILKFEVMQLEAQAEKRITQLGSYVYKKLEEDLEATVSRSDEELMQILSAIQKIKDLIEEKESKINSKEYSKGD